MSIQSEVSRLETAKSALASAITAKGVTVPAGAKLDAYAPLVEQIQTGGGGTCPNTPWYLVFDYGEPCPQEMLSSHTFNIKEMFTKTSSSGMEEWPNYVWIACRSMLISAYPLISWSSDFCIEGDTYNTAKISLTGANAGCLLVDGHGNVSVFWDEDCTYSATLGELTYSQYCLVWYGSEPY